MMNLRLSLALRSRRRHGGRRLAAVLLAVILTVTLGITAVLAASAKGSDLRLDSTEGTVTLTNLSGKSLSVRDGMKLYNGYTITTGARSYAYITLDSDRVVKLDAGSQAEVRTDGSKLELLLVSGELFFNVARPLSSGETLNIRTSTMVTGIRGTSGIVAAVDDNTSAVALTDGTVQVYSADGTAAVTVTAGRLALAVLGEDGWTVRDSDLTLDDIPGFAAVELARDDDLRQRVADATGLPADDLIASAYDRLAADQQRAEEEQAAVGGYEDGGRVWAPVVQTPVSDDVIVILPDPSPSGSGSSESPIITDSTTPTPSPSGSGSSSPDASTSDSGTEDGDDDPSGSDGNEPGGNSSPDVDDSTATPTS